MESSSRGSTNSPTRAPASRVATSASRRCRATSCKAYSTRVARASMSENATTRTPSFCTTRAEASRQVCLTLQSASTVSGTDGALALYSAATP